MPKLMRATPLLASLDIERSLGFYETQLGFDQVANHDGKYGIVSRDGIEIHLWKCEDPTIPRATSCRIRVEGIDALHAELAPRGVMHPNGKLEDKPWGMREFPVLDCDGNLITFEAPAA